MAFTVKVECLDESLLGPAFSTYLQVPTVALVPVLLSHLILQNHETRVSQPGMIYHTTLLAERFLQLLS